LSVVKALFTLLVLMTVGIVFVFNPTNWIPVVHMTPSQSYSLSMSIEAPKEKQFSLSENTERNDHEHDGLHATVSDSEDDEQSSIDGTGEIGQIHSFTPRNMSGSGYWLALHYSDQGTGAFVNLMSLLCLSSAVGGVRVVEPFIVGSNIGQNVSANWREEISFSDIFDSGNFHLFAKSRGYSSLVPYQTFLQDAHRKVLVAQYECRDLKRCRKCGHEHVLKQGRMFSKVNGFEMVGHVCLKYGASGTMSLAELNSQLYSRYNKSEVAVLFPLFAGVSSFGAERFRLWMDTPMCQRMKMWNSTLNIRPSKLVMTSADNYIHKYLMGSSYISVMVRFETVIWSKTIMGPIVKTCLDRLHKKLSKVKSQFGITNVALCLDVGHYGSLFFRHNKNVMNAILPYVNNFISRTIKEGMTLSDWDSKFTSTALRHNPAFVALMQKTIATRGDGLVLLGEGSQFQESTKSMFLVSHPEEKVIHLSNSCF
jgi:hypothetical protein